MSETETAETIEKTIRFYMKLARTTFSRDYMQTALVLYNMGFSKEGRMTRTNLARSLNVLAKKVGGFEPSPARTVD